MGHSKPRSNSGNNSSYAGTLKDQPGKRSSAAYPPAVRDAQTYNRQLLEQWRLAIGLGLVGAPAQLLAQRDARAPLTGPLSSAYQPRVMPQESLFSLTFPLQLPKPPTGEDKVAEDASPASISPSCAEGWHNRKWREGSSWPC